MVVLHFGLMSMAAASGGGKSFIASARQKGVVEEESQSLARPGRAMEHALATDSSLDELRSTIHAEPSIKLRLWHAKTVKNRTPVLRI
ncbi:hypothetical protein JCGZ_03812 [Jatropha curcas]|uniref:Uncharacterized protein n=1 Tax=Jatropha curcas TaxID=180498 RepID=A0A067LA71_JATCU|nr:hypothetical protein JCGZ_03812 [Jatropha curcas]